MKWVKSNLILFPVLLVIVFLFLISWKNFGYIEEIIELSNFVLFVGIILTFLMSVTSTFYTNKSTERNLTMLGNDRLDSNRNANKDRIAQTISKYRMDWLSELKANYKKFDYQVSSYFIKDIKIEDLNENKISTIERLIRSFVSDLTLELNIFGKYDNDIIKLLNELIDLVLSLRSCLFNTKSILYSIAYMDKFVPEEEKKLHALIYDNWDNITSKDETIIDMVLNEISVTYNDEDFKDSKIDDIISLEWMFGTRMIYLQDAINKKLINIRNHFRIYFKLEWERVKDEIKLGVDQSKYDFDIEFQKLLKRILEVDKES